MNISNESLDLQAQAATLDSIHQQALRQQLPKDLPHRRKKSATGYKAQVTGLLAESQPITQITQDNYLGAALCAIGQESCGHGNRKRWEPSPSELGLGSSGFDFTDGENSSTEGEGSQYLER